MQSFETLLEDYIIRDEELRGVVNSWLKNYFSQLQRDSQNKEEKLSAKLSAIKNKQANLLNLLCEEKISQQDFDNQRQVYLEASIKCESQLE